MPPDNTDKSPNWAERFAFYGPGGLQELISQEISRLMGAYTLDEMEPRVIAGFIMNLIDDYLAEFEDE